MTNSSPKVIPLKPVAARRQNQSAAAIIAAVGSVAEQGLRKLLQSLFDNVDDALFELADKAGSSADQSDFFEAMRELRVQRSAIELNFCQGLQKNFAALKNGQGDELESAMDRNALSLVGNNELEERVALESMVTKASSNFQATLAELTTRLDSLVDELVVTETVNPLGPQALCQGFLSACEGLKIAIRAKLVLLKLYDRYVIGALDELYDLSNQVLKERGILPGLSIGGEDKNRQAAKPELRTDKLAEPEDSGDVFADLQSLLHAVPTVAAAPDSSQAGLVAPGQAPQIPRNKLLHLLKIVQQGQQASCSDQQQQALSGQAPQQVNVAELISQLLVAKLPDKVLSLGQIDSDVINLVEMLFQFILDERNLAAPMKALIARLQIPFIKVAMLDKQFFSKGGHPARQLLNSVASASLGWAPVKNVERDPLYKKIDNLVASICNDFDADAAIFEALLKDFNKFVEAEERRATLVQQRTLGAEEGKARAELARDRAANLLDSKIAGLALPDCVTQLLRDGWSQALFHTHLKHGDDSPEWQDCAVLVDELIWSVQPIKDEAGRQQLLKKAPKIIKALRQGLSLVSYNPYELQQLFEAIEALHLAAIDRSDAAAAEQTAEPVTPDRLLSEKKSEPGLTLDQLLNKQQRGSAPVVHISGEAASLADMDRALGEIDELLDVVAERPVDSGATNAELAVAAQTPAPVVGEPAIRDDDPAMLQVDAFTMGSWFELQQDGRTTRCRLAAVIRSTGKYIFVNRSGMKVAEFTRLALAQASKEGKVSLLDDGLLFDRALESVIGDLRSQRAHPAS
jgi:hypothetical protein